MHDKTKNISYALKGKKVLVKTEYDVDIELSIDSVHKDESSQKGSVRVYFQGTDKYKHYDSIFDIRFIE